MAELAVNDQECGKLDEGEVILGFLLPADEQAGAPWMMEET